MTKKSIYKVLFTIFVIIFLIFVVSLVLFTPTHVESEMSVDTKTPVQELQVSGLVIEFEEGSTEPEVKTILEDCNLSMYRLDYDVEDMADKYYIEIGNSQNIVVSDELKSTPDIKKEGYSIISISEQAVNNEKFVEMLDKNNIQLKKFVWCYISFDNESKDWIPEEDAIKIKNELKTNKKVLNVFLDSLDG